MLTPETKPGAKGVGLAAERPVSVFTTEMGPKVAPEGTDTVILEEDAELTVALVAPKNTALLAAVVLKLVPVITTEEPMLPFSGEIALMVGCAKETATNIPKMNDKPLLFWSMDAFCKNPLMTIIEF